ncbi:MAG: hypothetical protein VR71_11625 [Roseovarius sp. BRH_c41]|uniref:ABC transporter ATP-binding protein n=1 Tax=Roseovarius sp. BRH_c41 TaxID=1629709 RepID=UPI0005F1D111|nr:ABC transporter ATP-binding protein [Roseovarius sp. BRH_c41]KJS43109.1 MAG: hypothetical protein VR71_11625 [Roseovarius sp. BRH_c41]
MLEIRCLHIDYSGVIAVENASLDAAAGQITTIVGANGAGKSSTLKAISGLVRPAQGEIRFKGEYLNGKSPEQIVDMGICHVPEGRGLYPYMSVLDNLLVGAHRRKDKAGIRDDLDKVFDYFPVLKEHRHRIARNFSGGQQQMIAIGRGIMSRPDFYLFDEPSIGLAPLITRGVLDTISRIAREENCGVLLVEQNAKLALDVASFAYVMDLGAITLSGRSADLAANEEVRRAYLGL